MTGHAGFRDGAAEPNISARESRCKVPFLILDVPGNRDLIQVPIDVHDVRIGVLARAYDVVNLLNSIMYGVLADQPEFANEEILAQRKWLVVQILLACIYWFWTGEVRIRKGQTGGFLRPSHLGLDERIVLVRMTSLTGFSSHISGFQGPVKAAPRKTRKIEMDDICS